MGRALFFHACEVVSAADLRSTDKSFVGEKGIGIFTAARCRPDTN